MTKRILSILSILAVVAINLLFHKHVIASDNQTLILENSSLKAKTIMLDDGKHIIKSHASEVVSRRLIQNETFDKASTTFQATVATCKLCDYACDVNGYSCIETAPHHTVA